MKKCPFCAEQIQDEALKCRFCNSMLTAQEPAGPAALAAPHAAPVAAAAAGGAPRTSDARVIYEGSPSWKAGFWSYVGSVTLALAGAILAIYLLATQKEKMFSLAGLALLVGGAGWFLFKTLDRKATHVRVSTATIDLETGLFGRTIETIQLWRVRDIDFEQTFGERLLGIARIRILSHDQMQPAIMLVGLPGRRELFTELRDTIAIARQSKNVVGVVD